MDITRDVLNIRQGKGDISLPENRVTKKREGRRWHVNIFTSFTGAKLLIVKAESNYNICIRHMTT